MSNRNPNELKKRKAELVQQAKTLNNTALAAQREFTPQEKAQFDLFVAEAESIERDLKLHESQSRGGPSSREDSRIPGLPSVGNGHGMELDTAADMRFAFRGLGDFLRTGEGGIKASLAEGSSLQYVLPGAEVMPFIRAYPGVDPFTASGASITNLPGPWIDGNQPIIAAGTDPSSFAEGAGPSSDEVAGVYVARLTNPSKWAFLCKPTEEAVQDIDGLVPVLAQEGIRRILNRVTKATTAALLTSLGTAVSTVAHSGDNLEDLLNLMAAIPSFFASPSNAFMGSRRSLALIRNTRVGANDQPVFDPTTRQILGQPFVVNDYIPAGKLIFGDFHSGVFQRRSGVVFQQLNEVYKESGKVGLRFHQRAQSAFYSDAATAAQSEQPLYLLTSDLGS